MSFADGNSMHAYLNSNEAQIHMRYAISFILLCLHANRSQLTVFIPEEMVKLNFTGKSRLSPQCGHLKAGCLTLKENTLYSYTKGQRHLASILFHV
jgi:hypothetical protein